MTFEHAGDPHRSTESAKIAEDPANHGSIDLRAVGSTARERSSEVAAQLSSTPIPPSI
jgi:hypothetical protein